MIPEKYAHDGRYREACACCRVVGRPCHAFHRELSPNELSSYLGRELSRANRELRRSYPDASYLPHERRAIFPDRKD